MSASRKANAGIGAPAVSQSTQHPHDNAYAGPAHYERLFGSRRAAPELDRGSLPTPTAYLRARGLFKQRVRGEWVSVRCPAHKSGNETHPSMRVSLVDGHFRCMACGVAGGDIVALHRLVTGLGFRDAVRDLGGRFHD